MKRQARTEQAVLGCLSLGPMSGYDIKNFVAESIGNFWSESFGQIYPALHRMEDRGWIEPEDDDESSGSRRKSYRITPRGRDVLAEWLDTEPLASPRRNELLLKLFFGFNGDVASLARHVEQREAEALAELERYRGISEWLGESGAEPDRVALWRLTSRFGEIEREAHLEWCREALNVLRGLQPAAAPEADPVEETAS